MLKIRKNIGLQQLDKELELLFSPDGIEIISPKKAFDNENITQEELEFLFLNSYSYVVVGETTIFASRSGELFTEFESK